MPAEKRIKEQDGYEPRRQYVSTLAKKREQNGRFKSEKGRKESISAQHSESSFILSRKE